MKVSNDERDTLLESPGHKVKLALPITVGRCRFYVVECVCGWSSRLHQTKTEANDAYKEHRDGRTAAQREVFGDG